MGTSRVALTVICRVLLEAISFIVFCTLDLIDFLLRFAYKVADLLIETKWKRCYCNSAKGPISNSGNILVSEQGGESKIVRLRSSKLELDEISDTLYTRPSLVSEVSKKNIVGSSTVRVNSTVVETIQGRINGGRDLHPIPRWSDCNCKFCTSWTDLSKNTLHVKVEGPKDKAKEDVLFIHGFISSSAFWTETLFPNFSSTTKSSYRLFAMDILGFGRSPKPVDSFYTLREHIEMIERSVIETYKVKSFHIVAHSLGCILALALAIKHPASVKSLTLLAPPYYPVPEGIQGTKAQYVMRSVAPRRLWPPIAFGASIACWYEHISRTICLLICKNHQIWEFLAKLITRNRIRTFLLEGFFCHTHNAAWHTLHNIICGTGSKLDYYLDTVCDKLNCDVNIFHGENDELIPVECSRNVLKRIPRARLQVVEKKDHITVVVGRQEAFARELEEIWRRSSD